MPLLEELRKTILNLLDSYPGSDLEFMRRHCRFLYPSADVSIILDNMAKEKRLIEVLANVPGHGIQTRYYPTGTKISTLGE